MRACWPYGTGCLAVVCVLVLPLSQAAGEAYFYLDDFEDGDISDWTVLTSGTGSIAPSVARSFGGIWGLHMTSIPQGDRACAITPSDLDNLDYTKAYTIAFEFNYDKSNDPGGFHFVEVVAMNDADGVARHVGLYLDTPSLAGGQDALIYRDSAPSNHVLAGLKEDVWYHLDVAVDPSAETYDLTITDPQATSGVYDHVHAQWVNQLVTTDIPLIGAGQSDQFSSLRVGDRNADAATYDHGEAHWDNIAVQGTQIPEPAVLSLLAVGGLLMMWRYRKIGDKANAAASNS